MCLPGESTWGGSASNLEVHYLFIYLLALRICLSYEIYK